MTDVDPNPEAGYAPIVSSNAFGRSNGPIFERVDKNGWVRAFRVGDHHINSGGVCHGGMLMTFADIVAARAVLEETAGPFVTVRLVSDFTAPAPRGVWVEGRAAISRSTKELVFVDGTLVFGKKPVLTFSAIFKKLAVRR